MPTLIAGTTSLKSFIDRIETLAEEKAAVSEQIKFVYSEVKQAGLNPGAVRRIIKDRKRDAEEVAAEEHALQSYREALAGIADTPLGLAALARVGG